ncbi:hypothetical protein GCM10018980_68610 [Streptomyces capoamus]|uniref:Uncharacterized protein n=1 Tax=Streptomyces capoamus TaxID=68183 RepID=A0A919F3A7_9ACTN|nr:hypothetical protein [Streptomyces capoamus]GGP32365.1 hypothetical protein GCM10010501_74780 [Streptomyces libani subsp. rufus]GHG72660.1 hypothetical protein GCM10018980_68610 [Streptomyces capoamus]
MTTTIITRSEHRRTDASGDDMFARVLTAINSHRTPRTAPSRARFTEPGVALGTYLLAAVRAQDVAIPARRRAPRTVAEMRARLTAATLPDGESDSCPVCGYWRCRCSQARIQTPVTTGSASWTGAA